MRINKPIIPLLLSALLLLLGACSIAPHRKTVVMSIPAAPAATQTTKTPGEQSFDIDKISVVRLEDLDKTQDFYQVGSKVFGWLDNDHLAALTIESSSKANGKVQYYSSEFSYIPFEKLAPLMLDSDMDELASHIVSLDWQYGFVEPLLISQTGTLITSASLSADKSKAWYLSISSSKKGKTSESWAMTVTDGSFQNELLDFDWYNQSSPIWSTTGNYLCCMNEKRTSINIYNTDGDDTQPSLELSQSMLKKYAMYRISAIFGYDPKTSTVLSSRSDGMLYTFSVDQTLTDKPNAAETLGDQLTAYSATLLRSGYGVALSSSLSGNQLIVLNPDGGTSIDTQYSQVVTYAFSDDEKYICTAMQLDKDSTDIYIGKWNNGTISDNKLILKGFSPTNQGIFFSPDNDKLFLNGAYKMAGSVNTALVVKFK